MMKSVTYDKKRIPSTVIIGIVMILALVFTITLLPTSWSTIQKAIEGGDPAASPFIAFAGALAIVLVIALEFAILAASSICLPFAINNRKSTLKPIRIISYVYDGVLGVLILTAVVKLILLFAQV